MWNDNDIPLGYLISFRCYGTWLHGDKRGSTDRRQNRYKSPFIPADERWQQHNLKTLRSDAVTLDARRRRSVEDAIRETCQKRSWMLRAINVRTNHVHVVVTIGLTKSETALNAFKANATRKMRENNCWRHEHSPWADKGSRRSLWNERSIERAIDYVMNGQGGDLPDFD